MPSRTHPHGPQLEALSTGWILTYVKIGRSDRCPWNDRYKDLRHDL